MHYLAVYICNKRLIPFGPVRYYVVVFVCKRKPFLGEWGAERFKVKLEDCSLSRKQLCVLKIEIV